MKDLFGRSQPNGKATVIVDVSSLAHRCAHGYNQTFDDQPIGHIYGAIDSLLNIQDKFEKLDLNFVFAVDGYAKWRREQYPEYKANRVKSLSYDPVAPVVELLQLVYGTMLFNSDEEADDLIAAYMKKHPEEHFIIVTTDKDIWQVYDKYKCDITGYAGSLLDRAQIAKKYFTTNANLIPISKALIGDGGDNIKGVPFIPKKDVAIILNGMTNPTLDSMWETVEALHIEDGISKRAYKLLSDNKDHLAKTLGLVTLREDVEMTIKVNKDEPTALQAHLTKLGCAALGRRSAALFGSP